MKPIDERTEIEDQVDGLVVLWEDQWSEGKDVPIDELCRSNPQLIGLVQAEIEKLKSIRTRLGSSNVESCFAELGYQSLVLHARGGMGDVFKAEDIKFGRTVAIKRCREMSSERGEAFRREANITSRLEHPGIVPVYDYGQDKEGHPFYTMRFIDQATLKDEIAAYHTSENRLTPTEHTVSLRRLIGHLVSVAKTIAYAHDRGVLHLDIKPQNIAVSKYGETLVLDWGLAEPFQRDKQTREECKEESVLKGQTSPGILGGTPAYSSPEQTTHQRERIDKRTDVFLLGSTLYHILTGQPPFVSNSDQCNNLTAKCPPPRQLKPKTPPALSEICRRAMQPEASDRYKTALEFADELENWLADEPVIAYREPLLAQAGRWLRRHKTIASNVFLLLLTTVVGLTIGLAAVKQEQQRTEAANKATTQALSLAKENEQKAVEQKEFAERNALLVMESTKDLILVSAKYADIAKKLLAKEGLIESTNEPIATLQLMAKKHPEVKEFRHHLAWYWLQLGNYSSGAQEIDSATKYYERAETMARTLVKEEPNSAKFRDFLSAALINLSNVFRNKDIEVAKKKIDEGMIIRKQLVKEFPANLQFQVDLAICHHSQGQLFAMEDRPEVAFQSFDQMVKLLEHAKEKNVRNSKLNRYLTFGYIQCGSIHSSQRSHVKARIALDKASECAETSNLTSKIDVSYFIIAAEITLLISLTKYDQPEPDVVCNAICNIGKLLNSVRWNGKKPSQKFTGKIRKNLALWSQYISYRIVELQSKANYFNTPENYKKLQTDPRLDPFRHTPQFQKVLSLAKKNQP